MDAKMEKEGSYLNPPPVKPVRYQRNFIKNAVCELRFPTLLELETKAPKELQAKLRKLYPFYEPQLVENVGAPEGASSSYHRYLFRSKDKNWTVSVNSSAISLETLNYTDFEEFFERLCYMLDCARGMIDSDFFTRIGLRYINSIPIPVTDGTPEGWVNSDLILPITRGVLGDIQTSAATIQGFLKRGQYTMRHGFKVAKEPGGNDVVNYSLDFDYYDENVEFGELHALLKSYNETNFNFFSWCIGEKAKALLGEGKAK